MLLSEAWGKRFTKKTRSKKSRDTVSLSLGLFVHQQNLSTHMILCFLPYGSLKKITYHCPNSPVCIHMSSAELSQKLDWYRSIILFPWNYSIKKRHKRLRVFVKYGFYVNFFRGTTFHTSYPGDRIDRARIFKVYKDPRHRFHGIDSLWEISSVVELILALGRWGRRNWERSEYTLFL